ncbi:MAG: hypothetical protein Q9219_003678 [cf. Caloplaca sp. 3 TL-2023]
MEQPNTCDMGFAVPTITLADLYTFQRRHFTVDVAPTVQDPPDQPSYAKTSQSNLGINDADQEDEDDDLGYYPDGAKRTLTDEQISIFRDSEIYSHLRRRQVHKENEEADEARDSMEADASWLTVEHDDERLSKNCQGLLHGDEMNLAAGKGTTEKQGENGNSNEHQFSEPSRRQIRELDHVRADVGDLDYGDEAGTVQEGKSAADVRTPARAQIDYVDYEDHGKTSKRQETEPPKQGRKIWWPSIG